MIERLVQTSALICQNSVADFNSRSLQNLKTFSRVPRIWINRANHDPVDASRFDRLRAGRRAPVRATRFERHVKRRAARMVAVLLRVTERRDFRVGLARAPMPAAPDDFSALHQHRADHGIGRSRAKTAPGEAKGEAHEWGVRHFLSCSSRREDAQNNLTGEISDSSPGLLQSKNRRGPRWRSRLRGLGKP